MSGFAYRFVMRLAHRFNWHYAPPVYPDGDTMLWCQWCGMRDVVKRANCPPIGSGAERRANTTDATGATMTTAKRATRSEGQTETSSSVAVEHPAGEGE